MHSFSKYALGLKMSPYIFMGHPISIAEAGLNWLTENMQYRVDAFGKQWGASNLLGEISTEYHHQRLIISYYPFALLSLPTVGSDGKPPTFLFNLSPSCPSEIENLDMEMFGDLPRILSPDLNNAGKLLGDDCIVRVVKI